MRGALCIAHFAAREGYKGILFPDANAQEASLVSGTTIYGLRDLDDLINFIRCDITPDQTAYSKDFSATRLNLPDFQEVKGQPGVKRALEITAAGGHNTLIIGCPGIGKTMLARRLSSILPPMTFAEALETTRIYSILNNNEPLHGLITDRPFRSPHHTASEMALAGGGSIPMPGEISLAHNGVLFLDELPEFRRHVIEVLRQPIEERKVVIARSKMVLAFPASFLLLASMNPCPCGYFNHPTRLCTCSRKAIYWYRRKISGPLLERIDLHIEAEPLLPEQLISNAPGESSAIIRARVINARQMQLIRFSGIDQVYSNAQIPDAQIETLCEPEATARKLLLKHVQIQQLSARSYVRILKVAQTIADLAGSSLIELPHVAEALSYRNLDKPLITSEKNRQRPAPKNYY